MRPGSSGQNYTWVHESWDGFSVPEGAVSVQVAVRIVDGYWIYGAPYCRSHTPLIDNVAVIGTVPPLVVANTLDSGPGSLRDAIVTANASPDTTTILFDIPPAELGPITLATKLPYITRPIVIDGYSQPGASGGPGYAWPDEAAPVIELDGSMITPPVSGLSFGANARVSGLVIYGFAHGIWVQSGATVQITHNFLGPDVTGESWPARRNSVGLTLSYAGDGSIVSCNLISANVEDGLRLGHTSNAEVTDNLIGVSLSGAPLGNGQDGVWLVTSQYCEIIGNTIAYNQYGIHGYDLESTYNHIKEGSIHSNDELGINLEGARHLAPFHRSDPVPTRDGVLVDIFGDALSYGGCNADARAYFWVGPTPDPSGYGEGEVFLGETIFDCIGPNKAKADFHLYQGNIGPVPDGYYISVMAYNETDGYTTDFGLSAKLNNTPAGNDVTAYPYDQRTGTYPAEVTYTEVTETGNTFLTTSDTDPQTFGPYTPAEPRLFYDLSVDVPASGITVCFPFDPALQPEFWLLLGIWMFDVTSDPPQISGIPSSYDPSTGMVCGTTDRLTKFVILGWNPITDAGSPPTTKLRDMLWPAAPNPFNPNTTLRFDLGRPQRTSLVVYDLAGRVVRTVVDNEMLEAGSHARKWNGRDDAGRQVSSGVYFYRLDTEDFSSTDRMTLLK